MADLVSPEETNGDIQNSVTMPRGAIMSPEGSSDYFPGAYIGTGTGTISGDITVGGSDPANAYAILLQEDNGHPIGWTPIESDGTYAFLAVGDGYYAVVILDATGTKRAKVMHTILS